MAKTIALNLTINGVKQSITNINQLEDAIKDAEEQLKGVEIGSEQFKKLSTELKKAKDLAEDFSESIKGQDLEKRVGAFAKVGEGITASFAGAQAAISLFGEESEAVAQAAAKAQAVLTVALAARSAAEGVVAVRTVAANIATYASAAAATAATTATRTLWATLAANPYGAIIAAVGLLIGALVSFTSETEKATNVTAELAKATSDEADKLRRQFTILTQLNGLRNLQKKTLEDLKKEYPGFNAFIDKENQLNAKGVEFIKAKIKQYELEAKSKLLIQKIAENQIKIIELESNVTLESVTYWQQFVNAVKTGGNQVGMIQANLQSAFENNRKEIEKINKTNSQLEQSLLGIYTQMDQNIPILDQFNSEMERQVEIEEENKRTKEEKLRLLQQEREAYKKGRETIIEFTRELAKLDQQQKDYLDTIKDFTLAPAESELVDRLKKIQELRKQSGEALKQYFKDFRDTVDQLNQAIPDTIFTEIFSDYRAQLEQSFVKGELSLQKYYDFVTETNSNLSQEQKQLLFNLTKQYEVFNKFISEAPGFRSFVDTFKGIDPAFDDFLDKSNQVFTGAKGFLFAIGDISAAAGDFKLEVQDATGAIKEFQFDPERVRKNADEVLGALRKALFAPTATKLLEDSIIRIQTEIGKATSSVVKKGLEGQLDQLKVELEKFKATGQLGTLIDAEQVQRAIEKTILGFKVLAQEIIKGEQATFRINAEVQKLTQSLAGNTEELSRAIGGIVLENIDSIAKLFFDFRTEAEKNDEVFINKVKNDEQGLIKFREDLIAKGVDVEKASYQDLLAAYIEYKKKERDINKQTEDDKKKKQQETYSAILQGFELFSSTLNQISALQRERVQTDLQGLEVASKKALEGVVGDSETAAKKREEITLEYERKRKEIEKKGTIDSLKLSLVQTIANGAQAFVKALAELGPIAGPIFAGINAALTAFQIAIISDQIGIAQSMRRGGLLKAQGGMLLQGPSHEQGGIPLAQYGVVAEGNEAIINRQSSVNFRDLLSSINQSGGGRPLVVNNFDDSRIVEALAKQNQKPIRAYVLESEITNEQNISRRLDDLSKL